MTAQQIALVLGLCFVVAIFTSASLFVGVTTIDNSRRITTLETRMDAVEEIDKKEIKALYIIAEALDKVLRERNQAPPILPPLPQPSAEGSLHEMKFAEGPCRK